MTDQAAGDVLVSVGDIGVTASHVVTPNGSYPLPATTWIVSNQTQMTERIPGYAVVLAIVFFLFCLLGLLFLLIKERQMYGYVQVSVQGEGFYYATQLPVSNTVQVADIDRRVNYIRELVAWSANQA